MRRGDYAVPRGRLGLASIDGVPAACIALRPLSDESGEMKRLYVREHFRGERLGKALVEWVAAQAREIGYVRLYADTLPVMQRALAMYEAMGFERCAPYGGTGGDAIYLRLDLPSRVWAACAGYNAAMDNDKRKRDEFGELYEDTFTENESKPGGAAREDAAESLKMDPGIDSQEDDEDMANNVFGVNQPKNDK